jgi:hypothetical protein
MKCAHCGSDGFNRIVLDREKQQMVGAVCEECEGQLRSGALDPTTLVPSDGAVEFAEPRFALPALDLVATDPDEGEFYLEYTLDSTTPYLHDIVSGDAEGAAGTWTAASGES